MVGRDLVDLLKARDEEVVALARADLDITDRQQVQDVISKVRPSVIVNCAAYTKVDDAEKNEEEATLTNSTAVKHLADAANRQSSLLVHVSTDFVFDGKRSSPYEPDDTVSPLSAYGRSKLSGEQSARLANRHLIVRTAWLFGTNGWNFVEAIRKQISAGKTTLTVVSDQRGRPTYTPHLADALMRLARGALKEEIASGIFHYADQPECTWFDFASEIVRGLESQSLLSHPVQVRPVGSAEFPRPAMRPAYSVLSTRRYEAATGATPASWHAGLKEYLKKRA